MLQQNYAQDLRNQRTVVTATNQGRTADDLALRYHEGERFHLDLAEKYQMKAKALNSSADAVDLLRSRLTAVAHDGNRQIDSILASDGSPADKSAAIHLIHLACNAAALEASGIAIETIASGTHDVLRGDGIDTNARTWMRDNGFGLEEPPVSLTPRPSPAGAGGSVIPTTGGPLTPGVQDRAPGYAQSLRHVPSPTLGATDPIGREGASPTATPVVAAANGEAFAPLDGPVDTPAPASAIPMGVVAPMVPVVAGVSWSTPAAPAVAGPSALTEPMPAYGSDLRPPVAPAPFSPAAPAAPSAGDPVVSPVERVSPGLMSPAAPGGAALAATTVAAAGMGSTRAAHQRRLRGLVDAVARQEPRLSWAAGLRDDGVTTVLTTDLASGWIPPHVRLPARVAVLEPTVRRRDAGAVDLLGAVVATAAHRPDAHVADPGPDAPALTGDRAARSAAPHVDEIGPALVDAVRRRDGLPDIARMLAAPAARRTGVLASEAELLGAHVAEVQNTVLNAYPHHAPAAVADWMLLAAIASLIDDQPYLANYHLAWFRTSAK
ncbi:MAG: DUF5631 domain-containing protein [Mycobacterium sp.]